MLRQKQKGTGQASHDCAGARARPAPTAQEARPQEHGGTGRRGEEDWAIKKEVFSIADWEPRSHAYFYIQEDLICQLLEDEELR